jgi:hypothetical protein
MIRRIETEFWHGDIVYHKSDEEGSPGIITELRVFKAPTECQILYGIQWGQTFSTHYEFELSLDPYLVTGEENEFKSND